MLARAARRRSQRDAYRRLSSAANQQQLPWLRPALTTWRGNATITPGTQNADGRNASTRSRTVANSHSRSLVTFAETTSQIKASMPFDTLSTDYRSNSHRSPSDSSALPEWKGSEPLIIHNSLSRTHPRLNYHNGMGGDPTELHSNLHACLRVGRMDRAAALVRRIRELYNPTASELVEANNLYLLQLMDRVIRKEQGYSVNMMNTWLEVEMRDNDIQPNAVTYICMLRACIATMTGPKRDRLVRRYLGLAEQSGDSILHDTITSAAYSDDEYALLAKNRPDLINGAEAESADFSTLSDDAGHAAGPSLRVPRGDDLPEIKPVLQKGAGLEAVKKALSIFTDKAELERNLPYPHDLPGYTQEEKDYEYARMRQDRLEEDSVDSAISRWREEHQNMQKMGITSALQSKPMEALMWQWYSGMVPLFREELKSVAEAYEEEFADAQDDRLLTGPFLEAFTPEKLAATSLIVAVSAFGTPEHFNGIKVTQVATAIGKQLAMEHSLMVAQGVQSSHSLYRKSSPRRLNALIKYSKTKELEQQELEQQEPSVDAKDEDIITRYERQRHLEWSPVVRAKVGALCISKILESAKIPVSRRDKETQKLLTANEAAFSHSTVYQMGRKVGIIRIHSKILEKLKREPLRGSFGTKYPMVVEPLPWTGYRKGGYLRYPEPIIKEKKQDDAQRIYAMAAVEKGDMDQVLAGLTVLGKTAWRINRDVFKVIIEAWNTGEQIGNMAPENPRIEYPPEPGPEATKREIASWMRQKLAVDNEKSGYHSQRCFQNFQLEVARAFKDEVFYFPHNMDFRGRAYPIPPLLNHLGSDLARGLLTFAKGRELGSTGLQWLKIHLANLYGYDKASLKDREHFAMEHISDIYDACENPLTGRKWWLQAEDPWQCLATCYELKHAFDSPDPTRYVSSLPVHQDGTCNGLQHYAALGGDKAGAAQVNLEPSDKPSDIYSAVAALVKADVAKDAKEGHSYARVLDGRISRKVVKQTVMTNVYGVTFVGARAQVVKQLQDILTEEEQKNGLFGMGGYVAKLIFNALGQMFNGAQEIQGWLGACANKISTSLTTEQIDRIEAQATTNADDEDFLDSRFRKRKSSEHRRLSQLVRESKNTPIKSQFRATVIWTTPLKMPVVQPYRDTKAKEILTVLQFLSIVQPKLTDAIDKRKQLQGFPPNFIHSLDATHMLLSALKCNEIGLTFASVHDSFWTHAADVPVMNRVLRDAFVRMHTEDIIGRLYQEFVVRYKGCMYLASAVADSSLGKKIKDWRREQRAARSRGQGAGKSRTGHALMDELLDERQRQRLLESENEEEREMGRQMVTPGALYDAARESGEEGVDEMQTLDEAAVAKLGDTRATMRHRRTREELAEGADELLDASSGDGHDPIAKEAKEADEADEVDEADEMDETNEAEEVDEADEEAGEEQKPKKKRRKCEGYRYKRKLQFWLPLEFPAVPKKGDFDVRRLKDSQYFFS